MTRFALILLLALLLALPAAGQFAVTWDGTFNTIPADTDLVGEGDDRIRDLKLAISERMEVQHQFSTVTGVDTGRHREGSAWALRSADCDGEIIDATDEQGRVCYEDGDHSLWVADAGGGGWEQANAVPQGGIILWDQATGDELCTGGAVADECPCGFEKAGAMYEGRTVRGADLSGLEPDIPDVAGEYCDEPGGMGTCTAQTGMYDDTLTTVQMPSHDHDIDAVLPIGGPAGGLYVNTNMTFFAATTLLEGGGQAHYHPFVTVLFCRKK